MLSRNIFSFSFHQVEKISYTLATHSQSIITCFLHKEEKRREQEEK